jgi:hypothetical protein
MITVICSSESITHIPLLMQTNTQLTPLTIPKQYEYEIRMNCNLQKTLAREKMWKAKMEGHMQGKRSDIIIGILKSIGYMHYWYHPF